MIHQSTARFRVVVGGRRIGKSVLGGREAFAQACIPGSWIWILGPNMDLAEKEFRVVWELAIRRDMLPAERKSERELFIRFKNGSFVECRTEENPDQLIGEGLDLIVLAEAARLKPRTWHQYIRPSLADRHGKAIFTSTPRGFNWFYDFFERGQSAEEKFRNWESWQIPSRLNPILRQDEINDARESSTPEAFAQEWEAKFVHYAGLVFPEFDRETHVRSLPYVPSLRTSLWVDPGHAAPYATLLVQITPDEKVHVLDEIYQTNAVTEQIINTAKAKWPFLWDPDDDRFPRADVDVIIDKAAAEAAATWRLHGWRAGGEKPKIKQGIEVHHKFLRNPATSRLPMTNGFDDPGYTDPNILFDPKCVETIKEHGMYHYPDDARKRAETNKPEMPVDIFNHSMDALRYGYYNFFPELFNINEEKPAIVTASIEELMDMHRISLGESGETRDRDELPPWMIEDHSTGVRGFSPVEY